MQRTTSFVVFIFSCQMCTAFGETYHIDYTTISGKMTNCDSALQAVDVTNNNNGVILRGCTTTPIQETYSSPSGHIYSYFNLFGCSPCTTYNPQCCFEGMVNNADQNYNVKFDENNTQWYYPPGSSNIGRAH